MSIKLMAKVWTLDVSGTEREVLLVMTDHADDFGNNARPSIAYIAWKVGCDPRTVTRHIKELRRKKALLLVKSAGRHAPNEYRVNLEVYPPKPKFEYKGDKFHDAKADSRVGNLSPDNLSPDNSLSPKPPFSFNNNNNSPEAKPESRFSQTQTLWHQELVQLTGGYMGGAQEFQDLTDAWQRFPDERRHIEAKRQLQNARSRTTRVYLKAFLTFNPDYVPPSKQTYSARGKTGSPRVPAEYIPPTEAERAAFRAQLARAT